MQVNDQCANTPKDEGAEEVSRTSYAEYEISHVTCSPLQLQYAAYPGQVWPVIRYRLYFARSTAYYSLFSELKIIFNLSMAANEGFIVLWQNHSFIHNVLFILVSSVLIDQI